MIESVSKRAFSGSSGTYNVHALELAAARERKLKTLSITVKFLDDTEHVFHIEKRAKGSTLLEQVYHHLELVEKDYFGLQFSDNGNLPGKRSSAWMRWLDLSKSIKKQLGTCQYPLYFRVKFYVSDPSKLQEEYTRYQFYLQLRRDILEGKLYLPPSTAILLASYTVQSELGDYQPEEHGPNYLSNIQLVPNQTDDIEKKISELHKLHKGQLPADAEFNFLDHAKRIEMYGVELHKARDSANKEIQLGVTHLGLVVFQNNIRINVFSWSKIMKISFKRKQFFIQLRRELSESYDTLLGFNMETYRSSKTLWKSCVEHHTFFRLHSPRVKRKFPLSLGSKFTYSGRTEYQTVAEVRQRGILERKFVRSPSKYLVGRTSTHTPPHLEDRGKLITAPARPPGPYAHKVTSLDTKEPKKAWTEDSRISDDDGGFLERTLEGPFSPGIAGRVISYADEEPPSPTSNGLYDTPPYSLSHSPTSQIIDDNLVTIVLHPDEEGKYGFNVKGGSEQNVPILVSRVAPNTPADKCVPRLSEGDQLLQINGHDVTHALHQDVVKLIQEARITNSGKLVLMVKANVLYQGYEDYEEPPYQYVPAGDIEPPSPGNALQQSMLLLADGLASGTLIARYETLFRKHPDLTCDESLKPQNVNKNRYRDILPYDTTRVMLKSGTNGDYINANYVNMSISGTETVNHYIATQGPLPATTEDFWQMILEENCNLIVMLTTLIERGRAKCHKYWPSIGETLTMQNTTMKCISEETDPSESFVFRDFVLRDIKNNESRDIKHMQYIAWPDHGVPDSPQQFLNFTEKVRSARKGSAPVVVHCSAGIGRTGVMVLMETALCLMEVNEPVYPLEIVKTMREQRAMMIQNASQYRFVCESVHAAYSDNISVDKSVSQLE
ncbi:tyrosine-protein phosphatase non-receptor type 4 isoform X1 [Diorhabda carinulata]|uniref:tyrosine-protein phosphatase non-receptor type 4 isoform X1 n=1 Tax=Diorhabda carinulata TaxID=1163345 RepID=UPI0025A05631|nr:tyrosine-protein phosphatase non-receptor type 4 isoform X1 [Diorhabda carinulata]XP_057666993.1 tyrosine-protein phosphatase non-receptor type 4 isoform X1 [Diorhabda carinulata]XP_057666994.1 tyrosine-protein phosphatase non-receptor type 4 isoform X1 [Diorhabda carinulata]